MSDEKLVPKLRFSGFDDEWKRCKLKEICKVQDGTHSTPQYVDEGVPFYSVETITSDAPPKFISIEEHQKLIQRCAPKFGDILLTRIGTLAKSKIVDWHEEFSIYVSLALLSGIKINNKFLNQYIQTELYQKEFLKRSLLLAVPQKINLKDLNETIIKYPSKNEEEKIANFLNVVDKKIELLEYKLQYYHDFKKYLMQQIFAQKLRFEDEEDWKIMKIDSLISEYKEKAENNNFPVLSSTLSGIYLQSDYFDKNVNSEDTTDYKIVPKGYFTYRSMSDTGVFRFNIQNIVEKGIISPAYPVFTTNNINDIFLEQYLNNSSFIKRQILTLKEGGTRYALGLNKFKKLKIEVPSINEQNEIASCFETVDNKINNIYKELNFVNDFKKGLLQQMFV